MFLLRLGSELQNVVKKLQSTVKYKQNTDRIFTKWKISTKISHMGNRNKESTKINTLGIRH